MHSLLGAIPCAAAGSLYRHRMLCSLISRICDIAVFLHSGVCSTATMSEEGLLSMYYAHQLCQICLLGPPNPGGHYRGSSKQDVWWGWKAWTCRGDV